MKLCVPAVGKDLDARVEARFGRAVYFLIVDTDSLVFRATTNPSRSLRQGAGSTAAQTILASAVDGVLAGVVGPHAFEAFRDAGIRIFEGVSESDTVRGAIDKFRKGEFREASAPSCQPGCGSGTGRRGRKKP